MWKMWKKTDSWSCKRNLLFFVYLPLGFWGWGKITDFYDIKTSLYGENTFEIKSYNIVISIKVAA